MFYSTSPLCSVLLRYWNGLSIRIESTWWANLIVASGEWKPSLQHRLTRTHTEIGRGGQWERECVLQMEIPDMGENVRAIFQGFHNGNLPLACLLSCAHKEEWGEEMERKGDKGRRGERWTTCVPSPLCCKCQADPVGEITGHVDRWLSKLRIDIRVFFLFFF